MSALVPCRACGNEVSPRAAACPRCGEPTAAPEAQRRVEPDGGVRPIAIVSEQMGMTKPPPPPLAPPPLAPPRYERPAPLAPPPRHAPSGVQTLFVISGVVISAIAIAFLLGKPSKTPVRRAPDLSARAREAPTPGPRPTPEPTKATRAMLVGRARGAEQGKGHAACKGCGMPTSFGFELMTRGHCAEFQSAPGAEFYDCAREYEIGFKRAFETARGVKLTLVREFRASDARPGLRIVTWDGKPQWTVLSVDGPLMTVRYEESGTVEPKSIEAMVGQLYVMKDGASKSASKARPTSPVEAPTPDGTPRLERISPGVYKTDH